MTHRPKRTPIPPHRLAEARRVATESGWPRYCPDPACARGHCDGPLRPTTPRGPFSAPTCLAIAIRMGADPEGCTLREVNAWLNFYRPGEDWIMAPLPEALLELDSFYDDLPCSEGRSLLAVATALG